MPEPTVKEVACFLNVRCEHAMTGPASKGSSILTVCAVDTDRATLNLWASVLKPWSKSIFEVMCGGSMRKLG